MAFMLSGPVLAEDAGELRGAILISRHGVRATQQTPAELKRLSDLPWPAWNVERGHLTPRGAEQMRRAGRYYRDYFVGEGLLTGDAAADAKHAYFRANTFPRTIDSARALAETLLPGAAVAVDNYVGRGIGKDPIFDPDAFARFNVDPDAAVASLSRLKAISHPETYRDDLRNLASILSIDGKSPDSIGAFRWSEPERVVRTAGLPKLAGPLVVACQASDNFLLQYTEGRPAGEIGWGRVGTNALAGQARLLVAYIDLIRRTPYMAKYYCSTLGDRLVATLECMKTGEPVAGAFGKPGDKLVVIGAHDSTLVGLDGLFDFHRQSPDGFAEGFCPPGAAIVFELRQLRESGRWFVRIWYTCQTLRAIRDEVAPGPEHPPFRQPLAVAGCPISGATLDQPWDDFCRAARAAIDPAFVVKPELPAATVPAPEPAAVR